MAETKDKRYVSDNAQLMLEWDWERNKDISPKEITVGSHRLAYWIGTCGHHWEAQIKSRYYGRGCPVCSGKVVLAGVNDLLTTNPDLIEEWDYEKNAPFTPENILPGSHTVVWWKCKNGHTWQASPNHRTSKGRGCPHCCHNPKVLQGVTDLETIHPLVANEWHPTKNGDLLPNQVTANSSKRVWWKCPRGHEWKTAINHRANGSQCPDCSSSSQTSFPEQAVFYYVKSAYSDTINGYTDIFNNHGMELDIYIPSMGIGVEYDGIAYHRTDKHKQREIKKYNICKKHDIYLVRIREDVESASDHICDKAILLTSDLTSAIQQLKEFLPNLDDIDVARDEALIKSKYLSEREKNSLLYNCPDLCSEWHSEKNYPLTPEMFSVHSKEKVWWKCKQGHYWPAIIDDRVRGNGCPYCSNRLVLPGYNDLAYKRPDLHEEWDYSRNELSPTSVLPGSGKKAWWICSKCNHRWLAEISSRNKGHGCPECARANTSKRPHDRE